jgi:predicted DNA-binding protein (MmcQ/YjbR family)
MPKSNPGRKVMAQLRERALGYPGAQEEFPWGERVVKVNKKVFVFLGHDDSDDVGFSVKLPASKGMALMLPFAAPTGYGLGKAGWVTARFSPKDALPPLEMLEQWLDESYRAVAPAKLVAVLDGAGAGVAKKSPSKRTPDKTGDKTSKKR